jgi:hypothetical protein
MQSIIVNRVPIVNPQLASIIRNDTESVIACPEDSHTGGPAHCKVIMSVETRPPAACVPVIHHLAPTSHVRLATVQILTSAMLTEVKGVLAEDPVAISGAETAVLSATCSRWKPSISSVGALVPEEHAG